VSRYPGAEAVSPILTCLRYVLSPTHLHEFKSADKAQAPIMSLYLPEQKLGSHSSEGSSSNKFMLKGRQTGSMHRGHSWVFRAESYDTMMAWFEDIKSLTEKSPQERNAFVRQHARSFSGSSHRASSVSSDGAMDEEDEEPFSAASSAVVAPAPKQDVLTKRPQPGGRFPSDIQVNAQRGLQAPLSPSSGSSFGDDDTKDHDVVAAATGLPGSGVGRHYSRRSSYGLDLPAGIGLDEMRPKHASDLNRYAQEDGLNPYTATPIQGQDTSKNPIPSASGPSLGDAALLAAKEEAHRDQQAERAPEVANLQDLNTAAISTAPELRLRGGNGNVAPQNSGSMPALDYFTSSAMLAAQESATIAAPDMDLIPSSFQPDHATTAPLGKTLPIQATAPLTSVVVSEPNLATQTQLEHPSSPSESIATSLATSVATASNEELKRPTLGDILRAGQHHESVASASQLHVPGSFQE
jgi:hypothetical protein